MRRCRGGKELGVFESKQMWFQWEKERTLGEMETKDMFLKSHQEDLNGV